MAHTKLPWTFIQMASGETWQIWSNATRKMAHRNSDWVAWLKESTADNAAYMNRACNSFDELLAACEASRAAIIRDHPTGLNWGVMDLLDKAIANAHNNEPLCCKCHNPRAIHPNTKCKVFVEPIITPTGFTDDAAGCE